MTWLSKENDVWQHSTLSATGCEKAIPALTSGSMDRTRLSVSTIMSGKVSRFGTAMFVTPLGKVTRVKDQIHTVGTTATPTPRVSL